MGYKLWTYFHKVKLNKNNYQAYFMVNIQV